MKMPRLCSFESASGAVGPLAPSATIFTRSLMRSTFSLVIWFSSAAGIRMSTSCSSHASPGRIS